MAINLSVRPPEFSLPSFSLTSDLLAFLRCGLQYRYTRIGRLPSARPVQLWFGQFIHGVLEEGFRRVKDGHLPLPPWSDADVDDIIELIKRRLAAQGLFAWDKALEDLGDLRARVALNELGPVIFPIIHKAEVRLRGSVPLPSVHGMMEREADRYEMVGIIDVVSEVQLADTTLQSNPLVEMIVAKLPQAPPPEFEVIIDYKGMRRPTNVTSSGPNSYWEIYEWQLQTYAYLRGLVSDRPVIAGVIIYLNELLPTQSDVRDLRKAVANNTTDVVPQPGSTAESVLAGWKKNQDPLTLPFDFRLQRAVRVVPVTSATIDASLSKFDDVVARIEICRANESNTGGVMSSWEKNPADEDTCTACDSKTYCPAYTGATTPQPPRRKVKP